MRSVSASWLRIVVSSQTFRPKRSSVPFRVQASRTKRTRLIGPSRQTRSRKSPFGPRRDGAVGMGCAADNGAAAGDPVSNHQGRNPPKQSSGWLVISGLWARRACCQYSDNGPRRNLLWKVHASASWAWAPHPAGAPQIAGMSLVGQESEPPQQPTRLRDYTSAVRAGASPRIHQSTTLWVHEASWWYIGRAPDLTWKHA